MTDLRECPGSPYGHILVILHRRSWRRLFRKEYPVRCFDCDYVVVLDTLEAARSLVKLYHPHIIDEDFV